MADKTTTVVVNEVTETRLVTEVVETIIVRSSEQGLPGASGADGTDGLGVIQTDTLNLPTTTGAVIDSVLESENKTLKWTVTVTDPLTNRTKSQEILATRVSAGMTHQIYASIGDSLDFTLDVILSGLNIRLVMANNETIDLDVRVVRISTLI